MLVAVGARVHEHPPILGDAQRPALSTEHMISAAAMSTSLFEFMYFGYGKPTIRLFGAGVRISSAVFASRIHAFGLAAATSLNRDHSSLIAHLVLVDARAGRRADRGLEHRVDLHRHDDAPWPSRSDGSSPAPRR